MDYRVLKYLSLISQVGMLMAIPIVFSIIFGSYLDSKLGTGVLFLVIFTILGVLSAFRNLYVFSMRQIESQKGKRK